MNSLLREMKKHLHKELGRIRRSDADNKAELACDVILSYNVIDKTIKKMEAYLIKSAAKLVEDYKKSKVIIK